MKPPRLRAIPQPSEDEDEEEEEETESESDSVGYTPPPRQTQTQTQIQYQAGITPLRVQKPSSPPPNVPSKSPERMLSQPQPRRGSMPMNFVEQNLAPSSKRSSTIAAGYGYDSGASSNVNVNSGVNNQNTATAGMVSPSGATTRTSPPATATTGGGVGTPNSRYSVVGKPSGARAAPGNKMTGTSSSRREPPPSASASTAVPPSNANASYTYQQAQGRERNMSHDEAAQGLAYADRVEDHHGFEDTSDALAALTFLDREEQPAPAPLQPTRSQTQSSMGSTPTSPSESRSNVPQVLEPPRGQSPQLSSDSHQYRSSFAPSKSAAERKAKAQAQQAALQAATHKPGRANGKSKPRHKESGAWGESSDEEEEEEEEDDEDEDADSDDEPMPRRDRLDPNAPGMNDRRASPGAPGGDPTTAYPQPRRPRDLPQVPQLSGGECSFSFAGALFFDDLGLVG